MIFVSYHVLMCEKIDKTYLCLNIFRNYFPSEICSTRELLMCYHWPKSLHKIPSQQKKIGLFVVKQYHSYYYFLLSFVTNSHFHDTMNFLRNLPKIKIW
jgi:hypothetical protein